MLEWAAYILWLLDLSNVWVISWDTSLFIVWIWTLTDIRQGFNVSFSILIRCLKIPLIVHALRANAVSFNFFSCLFFSEIWIWKLPQQLLILNQLSTGKSWTHCFRLNLVISWTRLILRFDLTRWHHTL